METWDTIRARRNVRQYTDQPIARNDLERILDAGRRAASASNWQPWNFVVVTSRERLIELATVWQGARHVAGSVFLGVVRPVCLVVAGMLVLVGVLGVSATRPAGGEQDGERQKSRHPEPCVKLQEQLPSSTILVFGSPRVTQRRITWKR